MLNIELVTTSVSTAKANVERENKTFKDRLIFIEYDATRNDNIYKCHLIKVPLFGEEEGKTIDIRVK